jgi:hypothetical protein
MAEPIVATTLYNDVGRVIGAILSDGTRIESASSAAADRRGVVVWDGATCMWPDGRGKGSLFDEDDPACKMANWRLM